MLKKFIAIGSGKTIDFDNLANGCIYIFTFSSFFTLSAANWQACSPIETFFTDNVALTALYATEARQSDKDQLLFAGSQDGWVYIFDLR